MEWKQCKREGCTNGKNDGVAYIDASKPYNFCFKCNLAQKSKPIDPNEGLTNPIVENIDMRFNPEDSVPKSVSEAVRHASTGNFVEGAAFGLSCNLSLRKTLKEITSDDDFWKLYEKNVTKFFKTNKELKEKLIVLGVAK